MKDIIKEAQAAVIAQIGEDRGHGWGRADQMEVITAATIADVENYVEAVFKTSGITLEAAKAALMKWTPSEALILVWCTQCNGSAFRQSITSNKKEKRLLDPETEAGRSSKLFATFAG